MAKRYTICDGKIALTIEEAEEGGFLVTSHWILNWLLKAIRSGNVFRMRVMR